jgi:hypothetical protein
MFSMKRWRFKEPWTKSWFLFFGDETKCGFFTNCSVGRGSAASNELAINLTPQEWPSELGPLSDAIVPLSSQLNGPSSSAGFEFFGFVHSGGAETLCFGGPAVLPTLTDLGQSPSQVQQVPNQVIVLLNTWIRSTAFNWVNP